MLPHENSHPAFSEQQHRPWPCPTARWTWRQSWRDLLFAHWPVSAELLRPWVPEALRIDEFDGTSWIGVVPFRMAGVMRRPFPDLPGISAFPELNLRVYVEQGGKPGVWFLSLDAANPLAVWAARRFFHLPYFWAQMRIDGLPERAGYSSVRRRSPSGLAFEADYRPSGPEYRAQEGSLEHWLTERYCLYAQSPKREIYRAEVHHRPWPLQPAEVAVERNELTRPFGFELEGPPALVHFSRRLDVVVWSPERIAG